MSENTKDTLVFLGGVLIALAVTIMWIVTGALI